MNNYICKNCTNSFDVWGGIYFPLCPYCESGRVVRMTREVRMSEYAQHAYMRVRLRRYEIRIFALERAGYLTRADRDVWLAWFDVYFFDWYYIALTQWAESLPGTDIVHWRRVYAQQLARTRKKYEPYELVTLRPV